MSKTKTVKKHKNRLLGGLEYGQCCYCFKTFHRHCLTLDHLVPKSKGGRRTKDNMVLACQTCNLAKADLSLDEFLAKQG